MTLQATSAPASQSVPAKTLAKFALLAGVIAGAANMLVYFIAKGGLDVAFLMPDPQTNVIGPMPLPAPFMASLFPAIGAAVLLGLLAKKVSNPAKVFLGISVVFFLVSFAPLFVLPVGVTLGTKIALGIMHVVAAAVIVPVLLRALPRA